MVEEPEVQDHPKPLLQDLTRCSKHICSLRQHSKAARLRNQTDYRLIVFSANHDIKGMSPSTSKSILNSDGKASCTVHRTLAEGFKDILDDDICFESPGIGMRWLQDVARLLRKIQYATIVLQCRSLLMMILC